MCFGVDYCSCVVFGRVGGYLSCEGLVLKIFWVFIMEEWQFLGFQGEFVEDYE